MNLVLDFGNTRIKGAIFNGEQITNYFSYRNDEFEKILNFDEILEIKRIGITSVINTPDSFIKRINELGIPVMIIDDTTKLPIDLKYDTPQTLGADRICNAVAGFRKFPNKNVLIIDLGTCNKYDFVDSNGGYQGGSIAPGFKMRLDAMHNFTANLPLLKPNEVEEFIGKSTISSMETGSFWGVVGEINAFITQYQSRFSDIEVIATGGYLKYFEKVLKNSIFAQPNLTLIGLNSILNYQDN